MKRRGRQWDLPVAGQEFNLVGERGLDPLRVLLDRARDARLAEERRGYERRMQRLLSDCPGFIGAEAPASELAVGQVAVDPRWAMEARMWLGRRFHVCDDVELSTSQGLVFRLRARARPGARGRGGRKVAFHVEQFELKLL